MRVVCSALGVSHSHLSALRIRKADWLDHRKAPPKPDYTQLLEDSKNVDRELSTYGYRRVWGILRHQVVNGGKPIAANHKRVYRSMRDHNLLLYRHGNKPVDTRKHEGTVAINASDTRWCSDGFELTCDNGEKVRVAFKLVCCDLEVMSWVATTKGIDSDLVDDLMIQAVEHRFGACSTLPKQIEWLTDNGSCYTAIKQWHGRELCEDIQA